MPTVYRKFLWEIKPRTQTQKFLVFVYLPQGLRAPKRYRLGAFTDAERACKFIYGLELERLTKPQHRRCLLCHQLTQQRVMSRPLCPECDARLFA